MTTTPDPLAAARKAGAIAAQEAHERWHSTVPSMPYAEYIAQAVILAALPKIDATFDAKQAGGVAGIRAAQEQVYWEAIAGRVWNAMRDSLVRESEGAKG